MMTCKVGTKFLAGFSEQMHIAALLVRQYMFLGVSEITSSSNNHWYLF